MKVAKEHGCTYLFEASVGGGIPVLRTLTTALTAERITRIAGILNGTTNFILTKMEEEGAGFDETLKTAQELGYAESDPTADIEGHDTARKISILSDIMSGHFVDSDNVPTEGITGIDKCDIALASEAGFKIRLLGIGDRYDDDSVRTMVAPFLIEKGHPLAGVCDVFNAIFVTGNMLGDTMYYGKGAGKLATASAVVADVIDAARKGSSTMYSGWDETPVKAADSASEKFRYLVRVSEADAGKAKALFDAAEDIGVCDGKAGFITGPVSNSAVEGLDKSVIENMIRIYE